MGCFIELEKKIKRNGKETEKMHSLLKEGTKTNAFLKISQGTRKERVPHAYENSNILVPTDH